MRPPGRAHPPSASPEHRQRQLGTASAASVTSARGAPRPATGGGPAGGGPAGGGPAGGGPAGGVPAGGGPAGGGPSGGGPAGGGPAGGGPAGGGPAGGAYSPAMMSCPTRSARAVRASSGRPPSVMSVSTSSRSANELRPTMPHLV